MADYTIKIMLAGGEDTNFVDGLPDGCIASCVVTIPNVGLSDSTSLSKKLMAVADHLRDSVVYTQISNKENDWSLDNKPTTNEVIQ